MSNYKNIRLFESQQISKGNQQQKSEHATSIQNVLVHRMVEIDMFFFFYGYELMSSGEYSPYGFLYRAKKGEDLDIEERYLPHHQTWYIDKIVNRDQKKIVTFGQDWVFQNNQVTDKVFVLKIWDFHSLISQSYQSDGGLTGGTTWSEVYKARLQVEKQFQDDDNSIPLMVPIQVKDKPYLEQLLAVRFSNDGAYAAVVFQVKDQNEIMIYKLMEVDKQTKELRIVQEKKALKPLKHFKGPDTKHLGPCIDIFLFQQKNNQGSICYSLYMIFQHGIILYRDFDAGSPSLTSVPSFVEKLNEPGITLKPGCADFDYKNNVLIVDVLRKDKDKEEHQIRKFVTHDEKQKQYPLEGDKKYVRIFKNYIMSVNFKHQTKQTNEEPQSHISIYDFDNGICLFWSHTMYSRILHVEMEDDAVYLLVQNNSGQMLLQKVYEMENNVKIQNLMKKGLYAEAKKIAQSSKFPDEIIAEINKEYGDKLYKEKNHTEAIDQYIQTIGHLNPSYVIQKFIQVPQLDNLIKYLRKLTEQPIDKNDTFSGAGPDYSKDYTALLLNCFVKKEQFGEIKAFIERAITDQKDKNKKNKMIFDVTTAIEVCREHKQTMEHAITMAKDQELWKLLVQIYIEDQQNNDEAIRTITNDIKNVREKVEILQLYGPKILKDSDEKSNLKKGGNAQRFGVAQELTNAQKLMTLCQEIVKALVQFANNGKFADPKKFMLKTNEKVKIEDLLRIFVDHPDYLREFLQYVIKANPNFDFIAKGLSSIKLHHRLLECYLYKNQTLEMSLQEYNKTSSGSQYSEQLKEQADIKREINDFLELNDSPDKIDKSYVLFLFQIYNYAEGVKDCCQRLNLRHELLQYYMQHDMPAEVLEVCKNSGKKGSSQPQMDGDLWIQALTYFRNLEASDKEKDTESEMRCEKYLKQSLEVIGEYNILSPLLVLEILKPNQSLRFGVLQPFLTKRLQIQLDNIKTLNNKVTETNSKIENMREDIKKMKQIAKNFDSSNCSHCDKPLSLPTVHFMCGHTYHDHCIENESLGVRKCNKHNTEFENKLALQKSYEAQAHNTNQFIDDLSKETQKFNVIANYFGRGLFSDLGLHRKE